VMEIIGEVKINFKNKVPIFSPFSN